MSARRLRRQAAACEAREMLDSASDPGMPAGIPETLPSTELANESNNDNDNNNDKSDDESTSENEVPALTLDIDSAAFSSDSEESELDPPIESDDDVDDEQNPVLSLQRLNDLADGPAAMPMEYRKSFLYYQWKAAGKTSDTWYDLLVDLWDNENDIPGIFSSQRARRHIARFSNIKASYYDCCVNSCMCFIDYIDSTGYNNKHSSLEECLYCGEKRYETVRLSAGEVTRHRKQFLYIPFIPRLQLQCANPDLMLQMKRYRQQFSNPNDDQHIYRDIFDAEVFRSLEKDLFDDPRTIPMAMSTDGVAIVRQKNFSIWPILLINLNLPPKERTKLRNMMLIGIIPGPSQPKDLDSFLTPMIGEFLVLKNGVHAVDGSLPRYQRNFRLKSHLILVSGDGPGIEKCMQMTGSNGRCPCRFCHHVGSYSQAKRHYYFPHGADYAFNRRYEMKNDMMHTILARESGRVLGYNGWPLLLRLDHSLMFPNGFAMDPMHLLMNVCRYMFRHWSARMAPVRFTNSRDSYHLSKKTWEAIGSEMRACRRYIPTALCRTPRSIGDHWRSYKAKEWEAWVFLFSIPLLKGRLPDRILAHWGLFVRAMTLLYQRQLSADDREEMTLLLWKFVQGYEAIYFESPDQLPNCKSQFHFLLHLSDSIQWLGPAFVFWQFPCERFVGTLEVQATSKRHINTSLYNNVLLKEHIKDVCMSTDLRYLMEPNGTELRGKQVDRTTWLLGKEKDVRLSQAILRSFSHFLGCTVEATHGVTWDRLLLNGTIYSSKRSLDLKSDARCNHLIEFTAPTVRAEQPRAAYGLVRMYLQVDHAGESHTVAVVQKFRHANDADTLMPYYIEDTGLICIRLAQIRRLIGLVGSGKLRGKVSNHSDDRRRVWIVALSSDASSTG